jgi:hypothetical protein
MSDFERLALQLKPFVMRWVAEAASFGGAARVLASWVFTQPATFADEVKVALGLNLGATSGADAGSVRYSGDLQPGRNATYYTGYVLVPLTTSLTSTIAQFTQAANVYAGVAGIVPCDSNGDIYFYTSGELDSVYLAIYGYFL